MPKSIHKCILTG